MRLEKVQWYDAPNHWPIVEPWVVEALEHGRNIYAPSDILREILCRNMTLWVVHDQEKVIACGVTQVATYPKTKAFIILIVGGNGLDMWLRFHEALEEEARQLGCSMVEGNGRLGWKRVVEPIGYELVTAVYRKVLE